MIRDGGIARIEYAEVTLLGQKGEFGRYPLHVTPPPPVLVLISYNTPHCLKFSIYL